MHQMLWRFLKRNNNHWDTFRLSKMALETGTYQHNLDDYQIVPLANDVELTDKLRFKRARARYKIIVNELPERASRFSNYLHSKDTDASLDGLQSWITRTAELSTEPSDQDKRPKRFRPRLRAMYFDAACLAHTLTVEELVQKNQTWNEGFAGDMPLFKHSQNIHVFPILCSRIDSDVYVNMHDTLQQIATTAVLNREQMPLSLWLTELDKVTPAIHPVDDLKHWWEVEFLEDNGRLPDFVDLLGVTNDLRLHADDVPTYIMEEAARRSEQKGNFPK